MKTYSSRQLTIYISLLTYFISNTFAVVHMVVIARVLVLLGFVILFFLASYFYVMFVINKYISDKIRPVYKTIKDLPLKREKTGRKIFRFYQPAFKCKI
jgi:two-component system, OmpR family, phosphate regulon sensor histidine kinase PhoR